MTVRSYLKKKEKMCVKSVKMLEMLKSSPPAEDICESDFTIKVVDSCA